MLKIVQYIDPFTLTNLSINYWLAVAYISAAIRFLNYENLLSRYTIFSLIRRSDAPMKAVVAVTKFNLCVRDTSPTSVEKLHTYHEISYNYDIRSRWGLRCMDPSPLVYSEIRILIKPVFSWYLCLWRRLQWFTVCCCYNSLSPTSEGDLLSELDLVLKFSPAIVRLRAFFRCDFVDI